VSDDFWSSLTSDAGGPAAAAKATEAETGPPVETSPQDLGPYGSHFTDELWERLGQAVTQEANLHALADLVFHARHLSPREHAELARHIRTPFKRRRGKPRNFELAEAAEWAVMIGYDPTRSRLFGPGKPRSTVVTDLARQFRTSKEVARRALREAEARARDT
jgi:hypothetical protein